MTDTQNLALHYVPTLAERFWRKLGYHYHLGEEPEWRRRAAWVDEPRGSTTLRICRSVATASYGPPAHQIHHHDRHAQRQRHQDEAGLGDRASRRAPLTGRMGEKMTAKVREQDGYRRYGKWAGNPTGQPEDIERCAASVPVKSIFSSDRQCYRPRGFGPAGDLCIWHAKHASERD